MTIIDAGVNLSTTVCAWCEYHLVNTKIDVDSWYVLHDSTRQYLTHDCHSRLAYMQFEGALFSVFLCPLLG